MLHGIKISANKTEALHENKQNRIYRWCHLMNFYKGQGFKNFRNVNRTLVWQILGKYDICDFLRIKLWQCAVSHWVVRTAVFGAASLFTGHGTLWFFYFQTSNWQSKGIILRYQRCQNYRDASHKEYHWRRALGMLRAIEYPLEQMCATRKYLL